MEERDGRMDGQTDGTDGRADRWNRRVRRRWMDGGKDGQTGEWIYGRTHEHVNIW